MPELYVGLLHLPARSSTRRRGLTSVAEAVAAFGDEVIGIEWLQTFDSLPPSGQSSEAVQAVLAELLDADVAFVEGDDEDESGDPAEVLKAHVDHWVDEAAERFGEFSIGAYGFAVELRIDDEVELGWAYGGAMSPGAAELFGRAAEQARGGVDRGDG